jgi:hypothetical protein
VRPAAPFARLAAVGLLILLGGCADDATATTEVPACSQGEAGRAANGVVLMAQSVPSASWLPCVRTAPPLGWQFLHLDARDGISRFWLNSDRDGDKAIEVRLEASCDTAGATEIHSDREGLRRLERVTQTAPTFAGERYYVFDGGCITFVFNLSGESRGEPLALATQVVGVISRDDVRDQVHDKSGGRLSLDPATVEDR